MHSLLSKIILLIWCSSIIKIELCAQTQVFNYRNFSAADGLDTKTIYKFDQDKEGFVWLATDRGLYRFDGYKFKKFKSPLDNNNFQIGSLCNHIEYDSSANRLWIASYSDIQYFDLYDYNFHRPFIKNEKSKFNEKFCMHVVDKNKIWYGGEGFLYEASLNEQEINLLALLKNLPDKVNKKFTHITAFTDEVLLVTATNCVLLVDKKTYTVIKYIMAANDEIFLHVHTDPTKAFLWISANQCLVKYDMRQDKKEVFYFPYLTAKGKKLNNMINHSCDFYDSKLLLTNNILFDKKDNTYSFIENFNSEYENKISLEINQYKDKHGNIWRGSLNKGCNILLARNKNLTLYGPFLNKYGINMEPYLTKISNDKKKLYIAGSNVSGIISIDLRTHDVVNLRNPVNDNVNKGNIVNDVVVIDRNLYNCDKDNINKIENERFTPIKPNGNESLKSFNGIESMMAWHGDIIAVSHNEHYKINVKDGSYTQTLIGVIDSTVARSYNKFFTPLLTTADGAIWYGSNVGLYRQQVKDKLPIKIPLKYNGSILKLSILSAAIDKSHRMWLGTVSNGVWIYDTKDKSIIKLKDENEQWQLDGVNRLTIDDNNIVYISAQNGIYKFNAVTQTLLGVMNHQNGFIIDNAGYDLKYQGDDLITINTYPYIIAYKSTKTKVDNKRHLLLTSLKIANVETLKKPTSNWPNLTLKYPDQSFELEFTDLNLSTSLNHIFKYKLEGIDEEWIICQGNKIAYHRLPSGQFNLQIAYLDETLNQNSLPFQLSIDVQPPLWKKWWFVLLCISSILYFLYILYAQKMERLKNEMALKSQFEKQIATLEMKALRAQMNPHFIFNSLNSIQKFIFVKDEYAASQYLTKFSRLIRLILDQSNQELTSISNEIDLIKLYFEMEALRFDQRFSFEIKIDNTIDLDYKIPSMVIQPHIENAIWHGLLHKKEKGIIILSIDRQSEYTITITIDDNGIGRSKAHDVKSKQVLKKKSYGSKISEERVKLFNNAKGLNVNVDIIDKIDENGNALGTKVIIPIAYNGQLETNKD